MRNISSTTKINFMPSSQDENAQNKYIVGMIVMEANTKNVLDTQCNISITAKYYFLTDK